MGITIGKWYAEKVLSSVQLTDEELGLIHDHYSKSLCEGIRLRSHAALLSHKGYTPAQIGDILFQEQIRREEEAMKSDKSIIICDRGVFDIVVFSAVLNHPVKKEWKECLPGSYQTVVIFTK